MRKIRLTGNHFEIPFNLKDNGHKSLTSHVLSSNNKSMAVNVCKRQTFDVIPNDNKIYLFELLIHKDIALYAIEQTYCHNQKISLMEDGSIFLSFRSTQLMEVFRWVLGQGYRVKALNPPELIILLKKEIQRVEQYYDGKDDGK
jgi:predicted DNA-binding transcriptional regulator YafY